MEDFARRWSHRSRRIARAECWSAKHRRNRESAFCFPAMALPRTSIAACCGAGFRSSHAAALARASCIAVGYFAVSSAFHSVLVAGAANPLSEQVARETFAPLGRPVLSTVTGRELSANEDLRALIASQITAPVRFTEAVAA